MFLNVQSLFANANMCKVLPWQSWLLYLHYMIIFNLLFPVHIGQGPSLHTVCVKLVCMKLRGERKGKKKIKNRKIKYSLWLPLGCVSSAVYQTHKSNFKMVFAGYKHMTLKLDRYAALQAFSALYAYPRLTVGSFWSGSWSEPPHDPGSVSTALLMCYCATLHLEEHVNGLQIQHHGNRMNTLFNIMKWLSTSKMTRKHKSYG